MANMLLRELIAGAARRMSDELRERLVPHPGEQGRSREASIRDFLRRHLPRRFDVSTGFVFDAADNVSGQMDIVIADSNIAPRFETAGGVRFFPCEAVVAAGEVKSKITSRNETWKSFEHLRSLSQLDRSAGGRSVCFRTGNPLDHTANHLHRIFTFLFIVGQAPTTDLILDVMMEVVQRSESHEWPSMVFALDNFLATYHCDDGVCPNTLHARGIAISKADTDAKLLLSFFTYLTQAISATSVAEISSWAYLGGRWDLSSETFYATTDGDKPPYLSQLLTMPWKNPFHSDSD